MNINGSDLQGEDYLNPSEIFASSKNGHWDDNEHSIYLEFLSNARGDSYKKGQPLFKKMSEFIGTRSPSQCRYLLQRSRSHHQKFNPQNFETKNSKKKYFKNRIKDSRQPILRSKQIMRKYFALNRETTDEE